MPDVLVYLVIGAIIIILLVVLVRVLGISRLGIHMFKGLFDVDIEAHPQSDRPVSPQPKRSPLSLPKESPSSLPQGTSIALPKEPPPSLPQESPSSLPQGTSIALPKESPPSLPQGSSSLPQGTSIALPKESPPSLKQPSPTFIGASDLSQDNLIFMSDPYIEQLATSLQLLKKGNDRIRFIDHTQENSEE